MKFNLLKVFNWKFLSISLFLLFLPIFLTNSFQYEIFFLAILNALLVLGLNLLLGYTGQLSLAHGAFYILSPYVTVLLIEKFSYPLWFSLPISLGIIILLATVIAWPILKLKGHYLAMTTLGIGLIIFFFFK